MRTSMVSVLAALLACSTINCQSASERFNYLGQEPPSLQPKVFAPGIISVDDEYEFGSVFNQDVSRFFYAVDIDGRAEIRYSELVKNEWSAPVVILSDENYGFNDPFLSPDEKRLYFISQKALEGPGAKDDYDIWYVEDRNGSWSDPINAGPRVNSGRDEYYISFTEDGTMYFSSNKLPADEPYGNFEVYTSEYVNGNFQEAVRLGDAINSSNYEADVFIAPDESYIIFCSTRSDGLGRGDLYISFKNADDTWTKAVNMGNKINTTGHELCPFVTHDGKYFLYTSNEDIYWVSTRIFDEIRGVER
ncbi:MAG: hypothetical protein AAFY36_17275 [Bacteroidota bacterium]